MEHLDVEAVTIISELISLTTYLTNPSELKRSGVCAARINTFRLIVFDALVFEIAKITQNIGFSMLFYLIKTKFSWRES